MNKKYFNIALIYAVAGMVFGVFYREFTKLNDFTGETMLGKVHVHLLVLGTFLFLLVGLFSRFFDLKSQKLFRNFMIIHNAGLIVTVVMMVVRGVTEVLGTELNKTANGIISGIAGVGHILVAAGIVHLIVVLKKCSDVEKTAVK